MREGSGSPNPPQRALADVVFVGFNSRVAALDRYTGELVWSWKAPTGRGFTALLLDGDRLLVSIQGYTYCLHPMDGSLLWKNALQGFGLGVPSLASVNGSSGPYPLLAEAQRAEQQRSSAGAQAGAIS